MNTKSTYIPDRIEIQLPKIYQKLPREIFDGAKSLEEVQKIFHKKFVTTNEKINVKRKLDQYEVSALRQNYSDLLENKLPVPEEQLAIIIEDTKRAVSEAKDRLAACETQITDLASQARQGEKEITMEQDQCYRVPACGKYLYFAWLNNAFTLVHVENIPTWDADKIFSQGEQNVEAFREVLGIDIVALLDERKAVMREADSEEDQIAEHDNVRRDDVENSVKSSKKQ